MKPHDLLKILPTEEEEQIAFAEWLDYKNIKFAAIPNGGSRHALEAKKLKRTGVKPGFPDIFIAIPSNPYHGLFIEMKRQKKGKISHEQKRWISYLKSQNYMAEVTYGCAEAIKIVEEYLKY